MDRTWRFICQKTGARYIQQPVLLPVPSREEFVERFLAGVTPRTKVIFLSHITSQTALNFPVGQICAAAREMGILSIIDGAHVPGQVPLDLGQIAPDVYTGACHKWLCAPKGSAFLFVRPEIQPVLDPLVVSWGYQAEVPGPSQYIDFHEWQGTRDLAAYLSVPSAIQYQADNQWDSVRSDCNHLAVQAYSRIGALTQMEPLSPPSAEWFQQMVALRLPAHVDPEVLKDYLYHEHQIEILAHTWNQQPLIRVSFQAYNQASDLDALLAGLEYFLSQEHNHKNH
jgi:isopenicillin-N epimerase